jgi:single-strand DNA-binding protein
VNDTHVTVVGNVVDSPRRATVGGNAVTNFRMASTARRYDTARREFVDGATLWMDVECWNALSGNVAASVSKGDPVIVQGVLTTREWESEDGPRSKPRLKAFAVGPNLAKGRALFTKDAPRRAGDVAGSAADLAGAAAGPTGTAGNVPVPTGDDGGPSTGVEPSVDDLQPGRDYVVEGETLDDMDTGAPREPAHA